ncbi:MAG: LAGLIDADG family homing endonuclease [Nanoarchaeota archaeon]
MDWSYVAGFFDGEGNIHIAKSKSFLNGKNSYNVMIRIYQQAPEVLKEIQLFFGFGHIYQKKDVYELTFNKKAHVKLFLENIRDKIIVKKSQVEYLLKYFSFERASNMYFNVDEFRSFIKRKNVEFYRKNHSKHPPIELNGQPNNY